MGPAIVSGVFVLLALGISHLLSGRPSQLNRDAELYKLLPDNSAARRPLLQSIEARATRLGQPGMLARVWSSRYFYAGIHIATAVGIAAFVIVSLAANEREQALREQQIQEINEGFESTAEQLRRLQVNSRESAAETRDTVDALREALERGLSSTNP